MKLVFIVPDGVGVRNFVLGKFLKILPDTAAAHVFHDVSPDFLPRVSAGINSRIRWEPLTRFRPDVITDVIQGSLAYAQMYWARTTAMRHTLGLPIFGTWRRRGIQYFKRFAGRVGASPARMSILEKRLHSAVLRTPEARFYKQKFLQIRPTLLFCSQQLALDALPAVVAAKELRIPTVAFIFSWDNLTSKGRILAPFDHYLVWSNHMKQELLRYYPTVSPDNVHVIGTPQFEPYANHEVLLSREEFARQLGVDPARPIICYSGGDAGTCPEDPAHVRVLMNLIRTGQIKGVPQVVLRPVPVEDGARYEKVRQDFPELIFSPPKWKRIKDGLWSQSVPMPEDVALLANLTYHADLNINLGSTMTLDFSIRDKPVVNVAFDVANPPVFGMPVFEFYYRYEHLQPVLKYQATRVARSPEDLATFVNDYLQDPSLDREGRKQLVELQVSQPLDRSSERVLSVLQRLSL